MNGREFRDRVLDAAEELTGVAYLKKDGDLMVDAVLLAIEKALANGEEVHLHGFGDFKIRDHHGRESKWIDGTIRTVKPYRSIQFYPGARLKREVTQGIIRPVEKGAY